MHRYSFIFFLGLLITSNLYGQGPDFDQLKSDIINASTEERKIEGLINLGLNMGRYGNDSLRYYSDSLSSDEFNSPELVEAGQTFLKGVELFGQNQIDPSIELFKESVVLLDQLEMESLYFRCRNFLGIAYTRARAYDSALLVFEETIELAEGTESEKEHKRAAHANLINVYRRAQDFASAIYHTEMLIALSDEDVMSRSLAFSYMNMGQMLAELRYFERALDAINLINYDFLTGNMPLAVDKNKARVFEELGEFDSAIYYFERSLSYEGPEFNPDLKKSSYVGLINLYTITGRLENVPPLIDSIVALITTRDPIPLHVDLAQAQIQYYLKQNNLDDALKIGLRLEEYLNERNALPMSQDIFLTVADIYEDVGNTEKALYYTKLHSDLDISRIEARKDDRVMQSRAKLAELEAEMKVNEAVESSTFYQKLSLQQWILIVTMLIVSIIIYLYYRREKSQRAFKESELIELRSEVEILSEKDRNNEVNFLKLKSHAIIQLEKIKYIQSDGPYVEIFEDAKERPEIDRNTLKNLMAELPDSFIQVHRSYIVNIHYIQSIYSNRLELKDGTEISISRSFKPRVESALRASA